IHFPIDKYNTTTEIYNLSHTTLFRSRSCTASWTGHGGTRSRKTWPAGGRSCSAGPPSAPTPSTRSTSCTPWTASCPTTPSSPPRSEEHTSELQSRENLVCRLLLEKKK